MPKFVSRFTKYQTYAKGAKGEHKIQFEAGVYTSEDPEIVESLRKDRNVTEVPAPKPVAIPKPVSKGN